MHMRLMDDQEKITLNLQTLEIARYKPKITKAVFGLWLWPPEYTAEHEAQRTYEAGFGSARTFDLYTSKSN